MRPLDYPTNQQGALMINVAQLMKGSYSWLKPEGPVTTSNGVLLYAPKVVRAAAIIFCVVGIVFSVPYSLEHLGDVRLVFTRLFVVALACLATALVAIWIEKYYRACVLACTLIGTTVTLAAPAYMDGPNINPHAMLAVIYVLGAGFCLGRKGVLITLGWLILNYVLLTAGAGLDVWPHPTSIPASQVQYENASAVFFLLLSLTPVLVGYLGIIERSISELRKSYSDQAQLLQRLIATREGERKDLSHVLHEGPVQDLGALRFAIQNGESPQELLALVETATDKLRTLTSNLHPPILDHYGLPAALDQLTAPRGSTVELDVRAERVERLDPSVEIALFRIAQEALTNIHKHSNARHAWIRLRRRGDNLILEIGDDGEGFEVDSTLRRTIQSGHFGLATMHELATSVGGSMQIASSQREGTTVTVTAPYSPAPHVADPAIGSGANGALHVEENRSVI